MIGNKRPGFTLIELLIVAAIFSVAFLIGTSVFVGVQQNQRGIAGRQRIVADGRYILEAMGRAVRLGTVDYAYYADPDGSCAVALPASNCAADAYWIANDSATLTRPVTRLVVRDQQGVQTCYEINGSILRSTSGGTTCEGTWNTITPTDIEVQKFQVIISPLSDPYLGQRTGPANCRSASPITDGACLCDNTDGDSVDTTQCLPEQRCVTSGTADICLNVNKQPTVTLLLETKFVTAAPGEQSSVAMQTTVSSRLIQR